ncbi:type IV pilin N-terminal domain-containing protein [Halorientalis halophila]|uniref:type IV pilin N-terminal domain-containing protein n=1 Tax=Halorientalis halophila TaxID=3108499 RepID=UPI00300B7C05
MSRARAQSEVVGVVILTGVVVTMVGLVSVVALSNVVDEPAPVADLRIEGNDTHLQVTHVGGDGLAVSDLDVVVRGPDGTTRFGVDAANLTNDDGDARLAFGEALVREHGMSGDEARVLVVHRPTNEIVAEGTVVFVADE